MFLISFTLQKVEYHLTAFTFWIKSIKLNSFKDPSNHLKARQQTFFRGKKSTRSKENGKVISKTSMQTFWETEFLGPFAKKYVSRIATECIKKAPTAKEN